MRNLKLVTVIVVIVAVGFIFAGCGAKANMTSEMTGTWKSDKSSSPIKINLSGEKKTIEIGDTAVPVTIKKVDESAYLLTVDAKTANGKTAAWSLRQVWDSNGSAFTIKFGHNGEEETLTRG